MTAPLQPRYIEQLLKAAEDRKKEGDRRMQRKIQKERDQEGEVFADKEAYVTQAYRKKMQEMQEEEEKEMRRQQVEDLMDVTKQKDLTGFYRHLLKQSVGEERVPENTDKPFSASETTVEETPTQSKEHTHASSRMHRDPSSPKGKAASHSDEACSSSSQRSKESGLHRSTSKGCRAQETGIAEARGAAKEKRTYRTRKISDPSEDEEIILKSAVKQEPAPSSPTEAKEAQGDRDLDADSDFSVDSADSSDEGVLTKPQKSAKKEERGSEDSSPTEKEDESRSAKAKEEAWVALFKKRTVGDALEAAKARFLERKAAMDERRAAFGSVQ